MFYTYILQSKSTGRLYIGQTEDLEERLKRHNTGRNISTRNKGPWELIFSKIFTSRAEALFFERKLKSFKNKEYILDLIASNKL